MDISNKDNAEVSAIIKRLKQLPESSGNFVCAIDGMCGGGKTTLAGLLKSEIGSCEILPCDDFFLQPHQRTKERLQEVGGNIDFERLSRVLAIFKASGVVKYQPFSCKKGELLGEVTFEKTNILILEGSYSHSEHFAKFVDLKVFVGVSKELQKERLEKREGKEKFANFENLWIPKENAYFEKFQVRENSDFQICTKV